MVKLNHLLSRRLKSLLFLCLALMIIASMLLWPFAPAVKPQPLETYLSKSKSVYAANEKPSLELTTIAKNTGHKYISMPSVLAAERVRTEVIYSGREVNLAVSQQPTSSGIKLTVNPPRQLIPGKYYLNVYLPGQNKPVSQSFIWGALTINTTKSVYMPGETAEIDMAVLASDGKTVCNAPLELKIFTPTGEVNLVTVNRSSACRGDTYVTTPDYIARYKVGQVGKYLMQVGVAGTPYSMTDSFEVKDKVPFDVERLGPTRVFPAASYQMQLKIHANQAYSDRVEEFLPYNFTPSDTHGARIEKINNQIRLTWQVNWQAGQDYSLSYGFRVPAQSPVVYFMGPLTFNTSGRTIFSETRQWQLAGDALPKPSTPFFQIATGNSGSATNSFTLPSQSYSQGDLIVVGVGFNAPLATVSVSSITDTVGNTYNSILTQDTNNTAAHIEMWYAENNRSVNGNVITVNFTAGTFNYAAEAFGIGGIMQSSSLDQSTSSNGTGTSWSSGATAATSQAYEEVIGFGGGDRITTPSAGSGFSDLRTNNTTGITTMMEREDITSTGAQTATATANDANTHWAMGVATFKQRTTLSGDLETGTNGNTVATTDTGSATAWDAVNCGTCTGTQGVVKYDTTHSYDSLGVKIATGSTSTAADLQWDKQLSSVKDDYGRVYVYFTANPAVSTNTNVANFRIVNGSNQAAKLYVKSNGTVAFSDASVTEQLVTTHTIKLNQWNRIEWHITHSNSTGSVEIRLYDDPDSTVPDDDVTASSLNIGNYHDRVLFGYSTTTASITAYWLDNIVDGAGDWVGPAYSGSNCASPGTSQLLRGGDFFCNESENGLFWAK